MKIQNDRERIERGDGLSLPSVISFPNGKVLDLTAIGWEGRALCGRYEGVSYMGYATSRTTYYLRADGRLSSYKPEGVRFIKRPEED